MLIDYKDEQFVAYTVIKNSVLKKRMSHAYLIDANNYSKSFDFISNYKILIHSLRAAPNECSSDSAAVL